MREREEGPRIPKIVALAVVVLLIVSFLAGCAVGLNQSAESKVEEFRLEVATLNARLENLKREIEPLRDAFEQIARYLKKFWLEIHPEEK